MAIFEKNGIVYELNYNAKTGIVKYADCKIQEAKIMKEVNGCIINEIASKAFYYCENLKKVYIPDTVKKIKNEAFAGCKKLHTININNRLNIENIGVRAFMNCMKLKYLTLIGVKTIAKEAFVNCIELISCKLVDSTIETIEEDLFLRCENLQEFNFIESIKKAKSCFKGCENLKSVSVENEQLDIKDAMIGVDKNVLVLGKEDAKAIEIMYYGFNYQVLKPLKFN